MNVMCYKLRLRKETIDFECYFVYFPDRFYFKLFGLGLLQSCLFFSALNAVYYFVYPADAEYCRQPYAAGKSAVAAAEVFSLAEWLLDRFFVLFTAFDGAAWYRI